MKYQQQNLVINLNQINKEKHLKRKEIKNMLIREI